MVRCQIVIYYKSLGSKNLQCVDTGEGEISKWSEGTDAEAEAGGQGRRTGSEE